MTSPTAPRIAVLGQGLAGTLASLGLRQNGLAHHVYDRGHARASSYAAAGIVNPVTGRRFVLVEDYREYLGAFDLYDYAAQLLGRPLVHALLIYRDLSAVKDRNQWDMRRQDDAYRPFLGEPVEARSLGLSPKLAATWLGPTTGAYRVDVAGLIEAYRVLLKSEHALSENSIGDGDIRSEGTTTTLRETTYDVVIDCRGAGSADGHLWSELPWRLSKGEAIRLPNRGWPGGAGAKIGGMFLSPVGDGSALWYGGTSTDHFSVDASDPAVAGQFMRDVRELDLLADGGSVEYLAAVRPTMKDRATRAMRHATVPGLYLCNGFGTKGALVGPSVASELLSILREDLGVAG